LTPVEQEHAQLIDFQNERIKRLESEVNDLRTTLLCTMEMITEYFNSKNLVRKVFEDEPDDLA
jgi:hypothetical protein